ncbi:MAG: C45 family autoproteolytic acyltransferase/hydrolase [Planctomycetota bacterium]|jgi:hypothetical protein
MRSARLGPACGAGIVLFGLALASQFVAATYGQAAPPPPPLRPADLPEAERGRLRLVEGIPIVRLAGTPYEMGRQHGVVLKEQIRFLDKEFGQALVERTVGKEKLLAWARSVDEFIPAAYREELRGLADGAGMSYERALVANTMVDRFQTMFCSTVVAAGAATKDREVYFGRNLDFPGRNLLHRMTVVIVWEPEGGTPLVSVTWPGLVGVLSGMNAHGVCGATMLVHRGRELRPGMPYMLMYRDALARARNIDDVYRYIAKTSRTCANNFMAVDEKGAAHVVEFDHTRAVRRPAAGGSLCSTNHFRSQEFSGGGSLLDGIGRYETLEQFLARERGRIDADGIKRALADVATPWFNNVQSMIFLPARRALHLAVGGKLPAARQPFVLLERKVLFGPVAATRSAPSRAAK